MKQYEEKSGDASPKKKDNKPTKVNYERLERDFFQNAHVVRTAGFRFSHVDYYLFCLYHCAPSAY
ncbi:hypothetical protein MIDIC_20026 [Alphaproteobacteria bacterium]